MVERLEKKFNKPIGKIREFPVFWLTELRKSHWMCQSCKKRQESGSVALELCVRRAIKGYSRSATDELYNSQSVTSGGKWKTDFVKWMKGSGSQLGTSGQYKPETIDKAVKVFLCTKCGAKLLSDALARVETVDKLGIKGYRFIDEV